MNDRTNLNPVLVSVCVATYNREQLLKKLLESLLNQKLDNNISLEIVIADNNPEGSAKSIVEEFLNNNRIKIKYFIQPEKNISLTRNVCLQNAEGDYIAFIDDDETADEYWIINLFNCLSISNADGAFGYITPIFAVDVPKSFRREEYYFSPLGITGSSARFFYTTNAMIRSSLIQNKNDYFEPSYGLTGGEDVHFFERLKKLKAANFICCREAITYEYIPPERATLKYLFKRSLRGGQSYIRRKMENEPGSRLRILEIIKLVVKISLILPVSLNDILKGIPPINSTILLGDAIGKLRALISKYKIIY
jgi:succinoglycan biosynthesis protein ExoM